MALRLPYPYPDPITGQWDPFAMIRNLRVLTQQSLHSGETVTAGQGGTGLATYTVGDMLYASGTDTLAVRAIGSAGSVLTVSGGIPIWSHSISLGTIAASRVLSGNTVTATRVLTAATVTATTITVTKVHSSTNVNLVLRANGTSNINLTNMTTTPGGLTATLTNSPKLGNPTWWIRVAINGVTGRIPVWTV